MDCSTPGSPVLHYPPEFDQTHVLWVSDAIQPPHPLPPRLLLLLSIFSSIMVFSNELGLLQWVGSSHQVAKGVELPHGSFQWIFRVDFLQDWLVGSPCCPRDSQESFPIPQFKSMNSLALGFFLWSNSHVHIWLLENPQLWVDGPLLAMSLLFNMLSRLVIYFLPRNKHLLTS